MITHDFTYELYLSEKNLPFINVNLTPYSEKSFLGDGIESIACIRRGKSYLDETINEVKNVLDGKINDCDFGQDWSFYECYKKETEISDYDGIICTISTQKLYEMLLEWREFFNKHFEEWMNSYYY